MDLVDDPDRADRGIPSSIEVATDFGGLDADLEEPGGVDRIVASAEGLAARRRDL